MRFFIDLRRRAAARLLRHAFALLLMIGGTMAPALAQSDMQAGLANIQKQWEQIQYRAPEGERAKRLEALSEQAKAFVEQYPNAAESHTWYGIVLSSHAGAKGGLGALGLVKQAKAEYERAIAIDPTALHGSALSSLGVLYYKVPGWPIGFGDGKKAAELLEQGLRQNPDGIDSNYFYADYLAENKRGSEALPYLAKASKAAPRPGREIADQGRQDEIKALREKIEGAR